MGWQVKMVTFEPTCAKGLMGPSWVHMHLMLFICVSIVWPRQNKLYVERCMYMHLSVCQLVLTSPKITPI